MKLLYLLALVFVLASRAELPICPQATTTGSSDSECADRAVVASKIHNCFENSKCDVVFNIMHTCFGTWDPPLAPIYDLNSFNSYFDCLCLNKTVTPPSHPWYYCAACIKQLGSELNLKRPEFIPIYHASGARNRLCVWNQDVTSLRDLITNFTLAAEVLGPFITGQAAPTTRTPLTLSTGTSAVDSPSTTNTAWSIAATTSYYQTSKPVGTDIVSAAPIRPSEASHGAQTIQTSDAPAPSASEQGTWFTNGDVDEQAKSIFGGLIACAVTCHAIVLLLDVIRVTIAYFDHTDADDGAAGPRPQTDN